MISQNSTNTQAHLNLRSHITAKPFEACIVWANCSDKQLVRRDFSFFSKCLWLISFRWHSNMGPKPTHNRDSNNHIFTSTHIFLELNLKKQLATSSVTCSVPSVSCLTVYFAVFYYILSPDIKSWLIHLKGNHFIITISAGEKKASKDIKQNEPLQFVSKKCSVCTFCLLIKQEIQLRGNEKTFWC